MTRSRVEVTATSSQPRAQVLLVEPVGCGARRSRRRADPGVEEGREVLAGDLLGEGDEVLGARSEEHTSELQSLMRNSYAVFCLKKKTNRTKTDTHTNSPVSITNRE